MAGISTVNRPGGLQPDFPAEGRVAVLVKLAIFAIIVAALYFGRDILVPLALAMLSALRSLRRCGGCGALRSERLLAVLQSSRVAFVAILAFIWVISLAGDGPCAAPANLSRQHRDEDRHPIPVAAWRPAVRAGGRHGPRPRPQDRTGEEPERQAAPQAASIEAEEERPPLPVEIHEPAPTSVQIIRTVIGPLVSPLATAGIVIVFVIFMLLKREDLRDRFIRLAGSRDLPRTTQALDDAAQRVGGIC